MFDEPILLIPTFRSGRETPWAGDTLRKEYRKYTLGNLIGESYDFSLIPGLESTSPCGRPLRDILNENSSFDANSVPFVIKWTDVQEATSIHLHPHHDEYLLITNTGSDAKIATGIKSDLLCDKTEFSENDFQYIPVHTGEVFHIPAGVPHALCGLTCWTIQNAAHASYRLYDWNRTNARGYKRTLHNEHAAQLISAASAKRIPYQIVDTETPLFNADSFSVTMLQNVQNHPVTFNTPFVVMTCLTPATLHLKNGKMMYLTAGQSVYIPRASIPFTFTASSALLTAAHV